MPMVMARPCSNPRARIFVKVNERAGEIDNGYPTEGAAFIDIDGGLSLTISGKLRPGNSAVGILTISFIMMAATSQIRVPHEDFWSLPIPPSQAWPEGRGSCRF